MAARNPRIRVLRRAFWRYYALTLGAVTDHLLIWLDALSLGVHLSIPTTTDWEVEYVAAFFVALLADLADRAGIAQSRLGRFLLGP
jgi:hypothetical protein